MQVAADDDEDDEDDNGVERGEIRRVQVSDYSSLDNSCILARS